MKMNKYIIKTLACVCIGASLASGKPEAAGEEMNALNHLLDVPTIKKISENQSINEKNVGESTESGNVIPSLLDTPEDKGEKKQYLVQAQGEKKDKSTSTVISEKPPEQAAGVPAAMNVKANTTVSLKSGKTQAVHAGGTPCWVRVEDVPQGVLQLGVHSSSGEPPVVELFEVTEQVETAAPLRPKSSAASFSPQGLGVISLVNYTILRAGVFLVHLSRQDEQSDQVLLLVGPAPNKSVSETTAAEAEVPSPPETESASAKLPQHAEPVSETTTTDAEVPSPQAAESAPAKLPQHAEPVSETTTTDAEVSSPQAAESASAKLPQRTEPASETTTTDAEVSSSQETTPVPTGVSRHQESAPKLPFSMQVLVVLLLLGFVAGTSYLAHRALLHPPDETTTDDDDVSLSPFLVSDARYELDIRADGQSAHMPLNLSLLARSPLTIGRGASCTISLDDPQVSSLHAQLDVRDGELVMTDCYSTNGTRLNGERVVPGKPIPLCNGDSVSIASAHIQIIQYRDCL